MIVNFPKAAHMSQIPHDLRRNRLEVLTSSAHHGTRLKYGMPSCAHISSYLLRNVRGIFFSHHRVVCSPRRLTWVHLSTPLCLRFVVYPYPSPMYITAFNQLTDRDALSPLLTLLVMLFQVGEHQKLTD